MIAVIVEINRKPYRVTVDKRGKAVSVSGTRRHGCRTHSLQLWHRDARPPRGIVKDAATIAEWKVRDGGEAIRRAWGGP